MLSELLSSDAELNSGWFECLACHARIEATALGDLLDKIEIDFSIWLSNCHTPGVFYLRKLADAFEMGQKNQEQYSMPAAYIIGACAMRLLGVTWPKIAEVLKMPDHRIRGRYFSFMRYVGTVLSGNKEFLLAEWPEGIDIDMVLARKSPHVDKYGQLAVGILLTKPIE
jgi:hypothetical protein